MVERRLSVLIPVLNGAKFLPDLFAALARQSVQPQEIIVADSGSTDGSAEICKSHGARVIPVCREEFDHGTTRNLLAAAASGDILLYFTQDALLAADDSLAHLVDALIADESIACAYGRQLPAQNASLQAASLRSFNYPEQSQVRQYRDHLHYGLKTIFISNSYAAYKKDIFSAAGGFQDGLIFGEDTCFVGKLLASGYKVAYCAKATVYHSHNYRLPEEFRRSFDIGVLHASEKWLLETYGGAAGIGGKFVCFALHNILQSGKYLLLYDWLLRNALKFLGYKMGRMYTYLPEKICVYCSMHRFWWKQR